MCISITIQKGYQFSYVLKSLLKKTDQHFVAILEVFKVERNMELENICEVKHPPITLLKSVHVFTYVEFILELLDIDRVNIIYLWKSNMGFFRVCTFVYATTFQRFCWPKEDSMLTNSFVVGRLSPTYKKI